VAGQVEVANNPIRGASCDMAYIFDPGKGQNQSPGDGKALVKLWRFHHNRRDFSADKPPFAIPSGSNDVRLRHRRRQAASLKKGLNTPLSVPGAKTLREIVVPHEQQGRDAPESLFRKPASGGRQPPVF
jgi:hypothetical protein